MDPRLKLIYEFQTVLAITSVCVIARPPRQMFMRTASTDQSGREERFYGKLGETVKEIRTIASKTQGNSPNSPEMWTTEYLFDTFGRLLE